MKLGIMQPYFFPYLGYFDLINCTDRWVVFDTAQYIRHGWVNRNRILHPNVGWQYIIVPIQKHVQKATIQEIKVHSDAAWRNRILGQLQHYKKCAPYYSSTIELVQDCFDVEEMSLSRLNTVILAKVCSFIGIQLKYEYFSEMKIELGSVEGPGDWALRISEALGAKEYVNPPGGVEIFDNAKFKASGIKLTLRQGPVLEYSCSDYHFEPRLSIIDVLMWNKPQDVKRHLDINRY